MGVTAAVRVREVDIRYLSLTRVHEVRDAGAFQFSLHLCTCDVDGFSSAEMSETSVDILLFAIGCIEEVSGGAERDENQTVVQVRARR